MSETEERPIPHELDAGEQLYRISEQTNDDGTVNVEVVTWEKDGNEVVVEFMLPTGDTFTRRMDWPKYDSDEYQFIRLIRKAGLSPVAADALEGEYVPASRTDFEWAVDLEPGLTRWGMIQQAVSKAQFPSDKRTDMDEPLGFFPLLIFGIILFPVVFVAAPFSEFNEYGMGIATALWVLATWATLVVGLSVIVV